MIGTSIIQWNIQGLSNKKQEILQVIHEHKASILALQETQLKTEFLPKIPDFNVINKEGPSGARQHGGVAMYIHRSVPFDPVDLDTPFQAVAATVHLKTRLTLCNIYCPPSQLLNPNELLQLFNQLPQPCLLIGDFNAYSTRWGCNTTNTRGRNMESFLENSELELLNNGAPTHPNRVQDTAIDLSLCSPQLLADFEWNTLPTVLDSDHFPIVISTHIDEPNPEPVRIMRKADWMLYRNSTIWENIPENFTDNISMLEDLYSRINSAANEAIPTSRPSRFLPKPWWTPDLTRTKNHGESFYQVYRSNRNLENEIR